MKSLLVVFVILVFSSCQQQINANNIEKTDSVINKIDPPKDNVMKIENAPQIEDFDIETFKKNIVDENDIREYIIKDSIRVSETYTSKINSIDPNEPFFLSETYRRTVYYPNEYFETYYYYKNGKPKAYFRFFSSYIETGIWYKFDEKGNITERIDKDKDYKFSLEDVIQFGLSHQVNFHEEGVVSREFNSDYNKNVYILRWVVDDIPDVEDYQENYILDGNTGEVLKYERKPAPVIILDYKNYP